MENRNHLSSKIWMFFGASALGLIIFAGLYFFSPRTIQVPGEIHIQGIEVYSNTTTVAQKQMMSGMKDVAIFCRLYNAATQATSEDQVRAKFELILKTNNIPINTNSENTILVEVDGYWDQPTALTFNVVAQRVETRAIPNLSEGRWSYFGHVGRDNANKGVLNDVEKVAEIFANDFHSANPKSQ